MILKRRSTVFGTQYFLNNINACGISETFLDWFRDYLSQ